MEPFLRVLRKTIGVLFTVFGGLVSVAALCGTGVFTFLWAEGEPLSDRDTALWQVCGASSFVGLLVLAGGLVLLRKQPLGSNVTPSLRRTRNGTPRFAALDQSRYGTFHWLVIGAGFLWAYSAGEPWEKAGRTLLGVAALYLGLHALFLCHELGHLTVAGLLGMDLQNLQVGTGPRLGGIKLGGLRLEWRAWWGGGLVQVADGREPGWRWRHCLMIVGGPAAHGLFCLALLWAIRRHDGGGWVPAGTPDAPGVVLRGLFFLAAYTWLNALYPKHARVGVVRVSNDGLRLLLTPKYSPAIVREKLIVAALRRVEILWEEARQADAWTRLDTLLGRYPDHPQLCVARGHFLALGGDYLAAAASFRQWLLVPGLPDLARRRLSEGLFVALVKADWPAEARQFCADTLAGCTAAQRAEMLDSFATVVLLRELRDFLSEADAWSRELLELEPDMLTRKGTRGSVLVEQGRLEEGEALLREVWGMTTREIDAALSTFYLGLVAKKRGQHRELRRWWRQARAFAPFVGKWLVERIGRESVPGTPILTTDA